MPFVAGDGRIVDKPPFMTRVRLFFIELWAVIVMFFKTLFGENVTKGGNNFTRDYRGGGGSGGPGGPGGPRGGPRPPQRRIGRVAGMSDIPCAPGGG